MALHSLKLKNTISGLRRWLRSRTHASHTKRASHHDATGGKRIDVSDAQTDEGDRPVKLDACESQGMESDERAGSGVGQDKEGWVARCRESAMRTGGYCEMMLGWAKEGDGKVKNGVVCFMIKGRWRQVPHQHWAWKPLPRHTPSIRCKRPWCDTPLDCRHVRRNTRDDDYTDWAPELLLASGAIPLERARNSTSLALLSPHPNQERDAATLGARIPPELFPLVYGWVNGKLARTCRLVCRYWEEQCRGRAFATVNLGSWPREEEADMDLILSNNERQERRLLELLRFKHDPTWRHIPPLVEELLLVPDYTPASKGPWLHLLNPRWKGKEHFTVEGPIPGRQTIRSIHFSLPRSVGSSFSRGITRLTLEKVSFRRFEDTACMVSDLPDLLDLSLYEVTWESLPTEPPHRRPRTNRNKLREVGISSCHVRDIDSPSFAFAGLTLFLHVFSVSELAFDVVAVLEAVLRAVSSDGHIVIQHRPKDTDGYTQEFVMGVPGLDLLDSPGTSTKIRPIVAIRTQSDSLGHNTVSVLIDLDHEHIKWADHDSDKWEDLNSVIALLGPRLLLAFYSRERMLQFSADVVGKKLPALSTRGEVRYAIVRQETRMKERDQGECECWYQASLESDKLQGVGVTDAWEVYP